MLRLNLRYIDLLAVYKQLDSYDPYLAPESCLANIPLQLSETLSWELCEIAAMVIDDLFDSPFKDSHPADVAAEVEEFISGAISFLDEDNRAPFNEEDEEHEDSTSETLDKFSFLHVTDAFMSADYWQITALLIYQYDYLCWLYQQNSYEDALQLFVAITATKCRLQELLSEGIIEKNGERSASERARKLAEKRHAPTNEIKERLLKEWDTTFSEYPSRADFSGIVARREGIKERTLYVWIGAHEKNKRT
ncbi:hypothetical protein [Pseudomonas fluorescens]|uniref:Uncharacterized protein n=1 Tax=Pseudomonas fluorescens TaxID=294 RepID=A0A5E7PWH5_PSEFL|nr:hypothetical protein [Pseudomonas fluorescens]VVP52987.1 hypothetical protein PS880_05475 [Pseudomonas fluorescens]